MHIQLQFNANILLTYHRGSFIFVKKKFETRHDTQNALKRLEIKKKVNEESK